MNASARETTAENLKKFKETIRNKLPICGIREYNTKANRTRLGIDEACKMESKTKSKRGKNTLHTKYIRCVNK